MDSPARERRLGVFHVLVTAQFVASAAVLIVWSLAAAGFRWWTIFSLSSQGLVILVLAAAIYGFAVFCGSVGDRREDEHPFTGSPQYRLFYLLVPLLAGLAGGLDYLVSEGALAAVQGWALGTVLAGDVFWLFVDPLAGITEMWLPATRRARGQRLAAERAGHETRLRERDAALARFLAERDARRSALAPHVEALAARLAEMLIAARSRPRQAWDAAATVGFEIWRAGGLDAMRQLYARTAQALERHGRRDLAFHLDAWWDGVGQWREGESAAAA